MEWMTSSSSNSAVEEVEEEGEEVENEMRQMPDVWLNGMTSLNSYYWLRA